MKTVAEILSEKISERMAEDEELLREYEQRIKQIISKCVNSTMLKRGENILDVILVASEGKDVIVMSMNRNKLNDELDYDRKFFDGFTAIVDIFKGGQEYKGWSSLDLTEAASAANCKIDQIRVSFSVKYVF